MTPLVYSRPVGHLGFHHYMLACYVCESPYSFLGGSRQVGYGGLFTLPLQIANVSTAALNYGNILLVSSQVIIGGKADFGVCFNQSNNLMLWSQTHRFEALKLQEISHK